MTKKYEEFMTEDRRLVLLRVLHGAVGNTANEAVLETASQNIGHVATRTAIREDLAFLQERGLVKIEWYEDKVMVATLTRRGQYVAEGMEVVDGICKPSLS